MVVVAIVGIDGSGKTTQAKMLVDSLKKEGYDATYVEPAFLVFQFLKRPGNEDFLSIVSPRMVRTSIETEKRKDHLPAKRILIGMFGYLYALFTYLLIAHRSKKRGVVVCDRYFFQFFFDLFGENADSIIDTFPKPDIAFFLDGQIDSLYGRMNDSLDKTTSETYYSRVKCLLERVSRTDDFIRVSIERDINLIGEEVLLQVINKLENNGLAEVQPLKVVLTVANLNNDLGSYLQHLDKNRRNLLENAVSLAERNGLGHVFLQRMIAAGLDLDKENEQRSEDNKRRIVRIRRTIALLDKISKDRGIDYAIIKMPYLIPHVPRDIDLYVPSKDRDLMIESLSENGMKLEHSSNVETTMRKDGYAKVDIYSRICYFSHDFLDDGFFLRNKLNRSLFDVQCPVLDETASFVLQLLHSLFGHRSLTLLDFLELKLLEERIGGMDGCRKIVREYGWEELFDISLNRLRELQESVYRSGYIISFPHIFNQDFILRCISTIEGLSPSGFEMALIKFSLFLDEWNLRMQGTKLYDALKGSNTARRVINEAAHSVRNLRGDRKNP